MYKIEIDRKVLSYLKKLDKNIRKQIFDKILLLSEDPSIGKPLKYALHGYSRVRVGKYRIIYRVKENEKVVFIVAIGHRKRIYRK